MGLYSLFVPFDIDTLLYLENSPQEFREKRTGVLQQTRQTHKLKTEKKWMNDNIRLHLRCHSSHCRTIETDGCTGVSHTNRSNASHNSSTTRSAISLVSSADIGGNDSSNRLLPITSISPRILLMSLHTIRVATSGRSIIQGRNELST